MRQVLINLIANALKFTRPRQQAQIEIGSIPGQNSEAVVFVRDILLFTAADITMGKLWKP